MTSHKVPLRLQQPGFCLAALACNRPAIRCCLSHHWIARGSESLSRTALMGRFQSVGSIGLSVLLHLRSAAIHSSTALIPENTLWTQLQSQAAFSRVLLEWTRDYDLRTDFPGAGHLPVFNSPFGCVDKCRQLQWPAASYEARIERIQTLPGEASRSRHRTSALC